MWLREKSSPKVIKYLESENAYTQAMAAKLKPLEETIYQEVLRRTNQTDVDVPVPCGAYLYYERTEQGKEYAIRCRRGRSINGPEEVVLDPNDLAKTHDFVSIGTTKYTDDGNLVAYTVDFTGSLQYSLQVPPCQYD
jgi:oligopeptidase B